MSRKQPIGEINRGPKPPPPPAPPVTEPRSTSPRLGIDPADDNRLRSIAAFGYGLMIKISDAEVRMIACNLLDCRAALAEAEKEAEQKIEDFKATHHAHMCRVENERDAARAQLAEAQAANSDLLCKGEMLCGQNGNLLIEQHDLARAVVRLWDGFNDLGDFADPNEWDGWARKVFEDHRPIAERARRIVEATEKGPTT